MPRLTGVWKKPIPTLTHDSEGFEACVEEATADVVERARTRSEVLCAQDGPLQGEGLLPEPKQRK